jgi:L-iditol 2-dehydrogenase
VRAALLTSPRKMEIHEVAMPDLAEGHVLIQLLRAGICGSDVSFYLGHRSGAYPFRLGHELVGRVAAIGQGVVKLDVGQRVIVEPNCPNKQSMGISTPGCFAEYVTAPAEFVWALPDSISDLDGANVEPLAVSLHALHKSGARAGDTVAVVGCGAIGLLLIHAAVPQGIRVLAHDQFEEKLQRARQLGAMATRSDDSGGLWRAEGVTIVFECAGAASTVELAVNAAPRGSKVVLLGLSSLPASFTPLRLVREGISIEPSLIYDHPADFARSLELVGSGTLYPSCIVSDTFPFDSITSAMEVASTGQSGKVHVVFP